MKHTMLAVLSMLVGGLAATSGWAQTCPNGNGQDLSQAEITSLLSGRYVYGTQYDGNYFNLLHQNGVIRDYKRGPNDPTDKSADVGTYAVGQAAGSDVVMYSYGSFSYSYSISPKPTGQNPPTPGPYVLCQRAGTAPNNVGQAINVTVSNSPGPVQP
jgi:hypothetical protein